jgi:PhnB protein
MNLTPFLLFDGNCAEAMAFYQSCLGGELTITKTADTPMKEQMPPEQHQKVVHAHLKSGLMEFSATDWLHPTRTPRLGNTVAMYISGGRYKDLRAIFDKLRRARRKSWLTICEICRLERTDISPINTGSTGSSQERKGEPNQRQCTMDIGAGLQLFLIERNLEAACRI